MYFTCPTDEALKKDLSFPATACGLKRPYQIGVDLQALTLPTSYGLSGVPPGIHNATRPELVTLFMR